ncbi:hypothetical protein BLOT_015836 [Blomia tropicalis]|nr:hypothetical protein BLOT_015836 [Blomia tropicalis]
MKRECPKLEAIRTGRIFIFQQTKIKQSTLHYEWNLGFSVTLRMGENFEIKCRSAHKLAAKS